MKKLVLLILVAVSLVAFTSTAFARVRGGDIVFTCKHASTGRGCR